MDKQKNFHSFYFFTRRGFSTSLYELNCDLDELTSIQDDIDNYYGKGELHTIEDITIDYGVDYRDKLKIVSKKYLRKEFVPYYFDYLPLYEFKYYDYKPSFLSKKIDSIIEAFKYRSDINNVDYYEDSLNLSHIIIELLNYKPSNQEEKELYKRVLMSLNISKKTDDLESSKKDSICTPNFNKVMELAIKGEEISKRIDLSCETGKPVEKIDYHLLPHKKLLLKYNCFRRLPKTKTVTTNSI